MAEPLPLVLGIIIGCIALRVVAYYLAGPGGRD